MSTVRHLGGNEVLANMFINPEVNVFQQLALIG